MKSLLLINDTHDQQNWGAQAGAYALKKIFSENPIQPIEIRSLSYAWMEEKYYKTPAWLGNRSLTNSKLGKFISRFSQPLNLLPIIADEYEYIADMWLHNQGKPVANQFIEKCDRVDVVVLNGEGSVYRNNYTAIKGLFLLWFARTKLNKPAFFLNGGVHVTRVDPVLPAMVRKTFSKIDGIAVREPWSQKNLKEFYPELPVNVVPDSVFYLFDEINNAPLSSVLDQPFGIFSPPMLVTAIEQVYRAPKNYSWLYKLVIEMKKIVPQIVLLAKEPRDMVLQKLAEDTSSVFFGPDNSVTDLVAVLRQAKFVVSGRYHHLILASILGVPCIPLATTSHKVHGLCDLFNGQMGIPYDCTDLENESEKILNRALVLGHEGKEYGAILKEYARKFSKDVLSLRNMVGLSQD